MGLYKYYFVDLEDYIYLNIRTVILTVFDYSLRKTWYILRLICTTHVILDESSFVILRKREHSGNKNLDNPMCWRCCSVYDFPLKNRQNSSSTLVRKRKIVLLRCVVPILILSMYLLFMFVGNSVAFDFNSELCMKNSTAIFISSK